MTPVALQNFANLGYDRLMPTMFMANLSITGATAAIYFKVKNKEEKSVIVSSVISGFLGITEPALFGILSKYKKAFIAACVGSGISSAFISFFGVRLYGYILSSIFSIPAYIGKYFIFEIFGIIIALVSSFVLAYLMVGKVDKDNITTNDIKLYSATDGTYIPLEDVNDDVFSTKMIGDGYAIKSNNGTIYAPVSGEIVTIASTKHAIGIRMDNGIEVLVHMGLDTVEIGESVFDIFVNLGMRVTPDTKIAQMNIDSVLSAKKDDVIIIVITNMDRVNKLKNNDHLSKNLLHGDLIKIGDTI